MTTTADDVRRTALSLPGTEERLAWGQPTFRVRGKIFASLADDDDSVGFRCPIDDRGELIAAEPAKFFLKPGHDDHYNWLRVRLSALDGEDELRAVLLDAWHQAAPRRLAESYRAAGGKPDAKPDAKPRTEREGESPKAGRGA
ncbi:MmcQ/YjbR family DNA-binding protein [Streptomyces sp. H27-D2]|uniref:MmcQ/YjbR family DNA-binding protein n=1 Tax=Streptomyces sp. H27-D2 TaxID=3046304 RepID=UPI002DB85711|nr:MmcQ/YjbR family DNA-binding protein [Streptomyces sp. H27-D2]MEC4019451.1 MmcQ/YjbR family DNA-binding protein [Streptomyces sp. H27-D2]